MIFLRTFVVTKKLIQDVERVLYKTTIVVQSIFFFYYGYSIYTNIVDFLYLVTYSLLLVISTLGFIHYLRSYKNSLRKNKTIKKTFRIFKYIVNGSMLVLNTFELIRHGGTDFGYLLIGLTTISLLFQIAIEFIRAFISQYIELFTIALDKDTIKIRKTLDTNFYSIVDAPLEILANKLGTDTQEMSKNEALIESLLKEQKESGLLKKKAKRKASRQRQKEEIKEHFSSIKDKALKKIKRTKK